MNHKINVLFYSKIAKKTKENLVPIYLRITINGQRIEQTTQRYVELSKWSAETNRVKGTTGSAKAVNDYLDVLKTRVYSCERQMVLDGIPITYASFKDKWTAGTDKPRMLLEVFQQHNNQLKALIGKEFSAGTFERYTTSLNHTRAFLNWKYCVDDIDIKKLDYEFVADYEFWLKSERNCNHNSAIKYISNFRKIVNICIRNGWLSKDPFLGFKMSKREVERDFLTTEELQSLSQKQFAMQRLNQVRDIFLFCCFTGLAYADVKKLRKEEITTGVDGERWIFTKRMKTETASRIPLLPFALDLIKKYENYPQCDKENRVLPVLSNQKMNSYLKEIADLCEIKKTLTFHIARHTFATTVTLSNGVPIESVSKMLGHKNLKTTQHYAKILDLKVGEDMNKLKARLLLESNS